MCIRYLRAWFATKTSGIKYQEARDSVRAMEQLILAKFPNPQVGPYLPHAGYPDHLKKCIANFTSFVKEGMPGDHTIGIGDSILAGGKTWLDSLRDDCNFALGGMWIHHMLQMFNDMVPLWQAAKFTPRYILVGTPGGNNFLVHQEVTATMAQWLAFMNRIREVYPKETTRIIIYGLPASIVAYIIKIRPEVAQVCLDWTAKDGNASFLLLQKNFVENNHILPKSDATSDGVHLTPLGYLQYDKDVANGKKCPSGIIIP